VLIKQALFYNNQFTKKRNNEHYFISLHLSTQLNLYLMKFFIDTANLDQIKEAQELGILDGVTTNPSLMAKEGITGTNNILKHYVDICNIVEGDVSAEVNAIDLEGMI